MNPKNITAALLLGLTSFIPGQKFLHAQNTTARTFYVSPQGHDKATGTLRNPLRTIQAALDRAQAEKDRGKVEIVLRGGCYEQDRTIEVHGRGNILIRPYGKEKVILSGGKHIPADRLRKVKDKDIADILPPQAKSMIREIDLSSLGLPVEGLHASGFGRASRPAWTQVFVDDQALNLSRWPNDSTVSIGRIVEAGKVDKGQTDNEVPYPVFGYHEDCPATWKSIDLLWISGYFAHGYADDMIKVRKIDSKEKLVHTAQHTVYGFMTGAPWRKWFALNLPEELDRPGEYVIDAPRQKIYLYPPKEKPVDIQVSMLEGPLMAIEHTADVTVEGITFAYGRHIGIYLEDTHRVLIKDCIIKNMGGAGICVGQGSLDTYKTSVKPHAAEAGGEATSRMVGDLQGKVYQDILFNRNAGTENGIVNCHIHHVGAGGISLGGGDRKTLAPAGNYVENCRIHDYNLIEKSYRPGIWMDGVGNRISRCDIYNAPSMAILFHGNNNLIELCNITHVCSEVDDQGAIYHGRDASEQGNIIRYCYFHELSPRHRVTATYHDDGACGTEVYGNIYFKSGSIPALIGGGHDNHYKNNIFINSPIAIHIDNRMQNWGAEMVARGGIIDQRLNTVRFQQPPYSEAYPKLAHYWDNNPTYPSGNVIEGNLFYRIGNLLSGRSEWGEFRNNWTTQDNPGFVDTKDPLKGFRPNAPIFGNIKDFPQIPFNEIGCTLPGK